MSTIPDEPPSTTRPGASFDRGLGLLTALLLLGAAAGACGRTLRDYGENDENSGGMGGTGTGAAAGSSSAQPGGAAHGGEMTAECTPASTRCAETGVETCTDDEVWGPAKPCGSAELSCSAGECVPPPSCRGLDTTCGDDESCCVSIELSGGAFPMGRDSETCTGCVDGCPEDQTCYPNEQPETEVLLSPYALDKYEVTVGRFRRFVEVFDTWREAHPVDGEGAGPPGSGWQAAWDEELPISRVDLEVDVTCAGARWTSSPADHEAKAMNCVSWYAAFAFCLWDGGRLPTDAEWEFAAVGGAQNRLYPWGSTAPSCELGVGAGCGYDGTVGSTPSGAARWGHLDLAGGTYEWTFDWYDSGWYTDLALTEPNRDPVQLTGTYRSTRGGAATSPETDVRPTRNGFFQAPDFRSNVLGFRCAR